MLKLPALVINRSKKAEAKLIAKTRAWLEKQNEERDPRIHASEILDPRMAYWNRIHPVPLSDKLVGLFFVGKVLHSFFLSALKGLKGVEWDSDAGGTYDEDLGITYAPDYVTPDGIPVELKTSRAQKEPSKRDLSLYNEQLGIYMVAKKSLVGRLVVLYTNMKDKVKGWGTFPQYRCYEIKATKNELADYRKQIKRTASLLSTALKQKSPKSLPLCREFKCGATECPHWDLCKPPGRWGKKKWSN